MHMGGLGNYSLAAGYHAFVLESQGEKEIKTKAKKNPQSFQE